MLTLSPESSRLDEILEAGASAAVSKAPAPAALAALIREALDGRVLNVCKPVGSVQGSASKCGSAEESVLSGARARGTAARGRRIDQQRDYSDAVGHRATVKVHLSSI